MGIIHIVMFTFEPLAPAEDVRGVSPDYFATTPILELELTRR